MKLRHIPAVVALVALLPFATSALTVNDLQQQISNLLAQIARLQEQLKLLQTTQPACGVEAKICPDGTSVGRSGPNCEFAQCPTPPSRICPTILRQLSQGSNGGDVMSLQVYLGVSQTGYFGPLTASAVAKFQANEGLSSVGIVGPQTRAAFARRCGGGSAKTSASVTVGGSTGGVTGRITTGPHCPVVSFPEDPSCADRGFQTHVNIYSGGRLVKSTSSDSNGYYSTTLNAGEYELRANETVCPANTLCLQAPFPTCPSTIVAVVTNNFVGVNISCDTGIR